MTNRQYHAGWAEQRQQQRSTACRLPAAANSTLQRGTLLVLSALTVHHAVEIPYAPKQCTARTSQRQVQNWLKNLARETQSPGQQNAQTPVFCYRHGLLDEAETAAALQAARSAGLVCQIRTRPDSACWAEQLPAWPGNSTAADWLQHVAHWGTLRELWAAAAQASLTPINEHSDGSWETIFPGYSGDVAGLTVQLDLSRQLQHTRASREPPRPPLQSLALAPEEVPYWVALREGQLREERRAYVVHLSWLLAQERLRLVGNLAQIAAMGSSHYGPDLAQTLAARWSQIWATPVPHRVSTTEADHLMLGEQHVRVLYYEDVPVPLKVVVPLDSEVAAAKCAPGSNLQVCHALEGHPIGCSPLALRSGVRLYNTTCTFDPAALMSVARQTQCWESGGAATGLCLTQRLAWGGYQLHAYVVCPGPGAAAVDEVLAEGSRPVKFSMPLPLNEAQPKVPSMSLGFSQGNRTWTAVIVNKGEEEELAAELCSGVPGAQEKEASCHQWVQELIRGEEIERYYSVISHLHQLLASAHPQLHPALMEGHTGGITGSVSNLHDVAKHPLIETVCEIGTNAGHSTINWLLHAGPNAKVYAFDLGYNTYTWTSVSYLHQVFGDGKFQLVLGDSSQTVPAFIENHPDIKCNLLFIDGSHTYEGAMYDLQNLRPMANESFHRIIVDDFDIDDVRLAWDRAEAQGQVETVDVLSGELEDSDQQQIMWHDKYYSLPWTQISTDIVVGRYV